MTVGRTFIVDTITNLKGIVFAPHYSLNLKDWFEGFFQFFKSLKNFLI